AGPVARATSPRAYSRVPPRCEACAHRRRSAALYRGAVEAIAARPDASRCEHSVIAIRNHRRRISTIDDAQSTIGYRTTVERVAECTRSAAAARRGVGYDRGSRSAAILVRCEVRQYGRFCDTVRTTGRGGSAE